MNFKAGDVVFHESDLRYEVFILNVVEDKYFIKWGIMFGFRDACYVNCSAIDFHYNLKESRPKYKTHPLTKVFK